MAELVDDPDLHAEVQHAVDDANKAVSKAEAIKKFTILPEDWTEADRPAHARRSSSSATS